MKTRMIGLNSIGDEAVVRCAVSSVEKLRTALAMISHLDGQPAAAIVVRSSGTIKGLGVRIQRRQR
jgi:RNase P/RNase MRP subunit POP5